MGYANGIILLLIFWSGGKHHVEPSMHASGEIECVTKQGYVAAISEKYLDDVIQYAVDKDYVAMQRLLDAGVAVTMTDGVKVYLVDTHIFSGTVEFRIPGYTGALWTVIEGIKCS